MDDNTQDGFNKVPELAKLITYSLFVFVLYGVVQVHLFYQLFLHIPIFQYIEASELVLLGGSTGVTLLIYFIGINLPVYFLKQVTLTKLQKIISVLASYIISALYFWLAYRNDPVIEEFTKLPLRNWWIIFPLILFVLAFSDAYAKSNDFVARHKIYQPILIGVWMALFTGYAHYTAITQGKNNAQLSVKFKSGMKITTNSNLIYAGRTQKYLFFYNKKTKSTRVVSGDDIDVVDFDSINR